MKVNRDIIYTLYSDKRTVFRLKDVSLLLGETNFNALKMKLNYYVRTGRLLNVRKGIYCKSNYNKEELACRIFAPVYISLGYVLQKAGVTFQYDRRISAISYLSREVVIDNQTYHFRKIKGEILVAQQGVEQIENISTIATPERAFLDSLYLNGEMYFDNLRPLQKEKVKELLPIYHSIALEKRVNKILVNGLKQT